jgi:hypothetical protein
MTVEQLAQDVLDEATGRHSRADPVLPGTGGPSGNARLTAWTGMILLVVILAEGVTLLDLSGLISWHIGLGIALIPLALLKTATTGWRIVRYYAGNRAYRQAGPPPMLVRLLGPLVIAFTLALLGSGLLLVIVGPQSSRNALVTVLGHPLSPRSLHAALALGWVAVTGVHVLVRLVPAIALVSGRRGGVRSAVPGRWRRAAVVLAVLLAAGIAASLALPPDAGWARRGERHRYEGVSVAGVTPGGTRTAR